MDNTELDEITAQVTGKHGFGELMGWLSDHAPALVILFVDLLAVIAEIRVYDAGMQITGQWYKAIGFVALSAVPFYLGQVVWSYRLASPVQKLLSGLMVVGGIVTAALFGRYDLLVGLDAGIDPARLAASVPWITGAYIILGLCYALADDTIQLAARLAVIEYRAQFEERKNKSYQGVLATMRRTEQGRAKLRSEYGKRVDMLEGKERKQSAPALPEVTYAEDTEAVTPTAPLSRKERK